MVYHLNYIDISHFGEMFIKRFIWYSGRNKIWSVPRAKCALCNTFAIYIVIIVFSCSGAFVWYCQSRQREIGTRRRKNHRWTWECLKRLIWRCISHCTLSSKAHRTVKHTQNMQWIGELVHNFGLPMALARKTNLQTKLIFYICFLDSTWSVIRCEYLCTMFSRTHCFALISCSLQIWRSNMNIWAPTSCLHTKSQWNAYTQFVNQITDFIVLRFCLLNFHFFWTMMVVV